MNLETIIKNEIARRGFISIREYMELCLYHPQFGYYIKKQPLGRQGDFITSPEISQLFGEIVAIYFLANIEEYFAKAKKINLIETGAGKGTLMSDILRIFSKFPNISKKVQPYIIEVNEALSAIQEQALSSSGFDVKWVKDISETEDEVSIIYSNELFDCFPVEQFIFYYGSWHQRVITIGAEGELVFTNQKNDVFARYIISSKFNKAEEGSIYEYSPMAEAEARKYFMHLKSRSGIFLTFDYGYFKTELKDTIQAVKDHHYADILQNPGLNDLTAHVDFGLLEITARKAGLENILLTTQKDFLESNGINIRAEKLSQNKAEAIKRQIAQSVNRLCGNGQMGQLFKAMSIIQP